MNSIQLGVYKAYPTVYVYYLGWILPQRHHKGLAVKGRLSEDSIGLWANSPVAVLPWH